MWICGCWLYVWRFRLDGAVVRDGSGAGGDGAGRGLRFERGRPGFDAAGVTMWMNFAGERYAEQGKRTQLRISFCREWRRCLASRAWRCRMICR